MAPEILLYTPDLFGFPKNSFLICWTYVRAVLV